MPTTTFVWDPVNDCVISELDGNGATQAVYTNEPQQYGGVLSQRRGSTSSFLHADALGTTRLLTSTAGATTDTYLLDAWGNPVSSTGSTVNPFRWVGQYGYYTDNATGFLYVRARMYAPTIARWCSVDPMLFLDISNLYVYALNSAVARRDPSGLLVVCCECHRFRETKNGISKEHSFNKLICLSETPESCCKSSCPSCPPQSHSYTEVHPIHPVIPPTERTIRSQRRPNNRGGYGHYCGPRAVSNGCLVNMCSKSCLSRHVPNYSENPAPIDKVDAICELHDCCFADAVIILICGRECNLETCKLMRAIKCHDLYPNTGQDVERLECQTMQRQFITAFCRNIS